jgi:hypothetical protein
MLGDFRNDVISTIGPLVGVNKVASVYDAGMLAIKKKAAEGARPYIIGAVAVGGAGFILGFIAILISVKNSRK